MVMMPMVMIADVINTDSLPPIYLTPSNRLHQRSFNDTVISLPECSLHDYETAVYMSCTTDKYAVFTGCTDQQKQTACWLHERVRWECYASKMLWARYELCVAKAALRNYFGVTPLERKESGRRSNG
jgi:hypothetical protein